MSHCVPDGLFHARFNAISNQHHIKDLRLASLVHFLQAAGGSHTIASALEPFESQAQGRFSRYNQ